MEEIRGATMTQKEAAQYLGLSLQSFIRMEEAGTISRLPKLPGARYSSSKVMALAGDGATYREKSLQRELDERDVRIHQLEEKLRQIVGIAL